MEEQGMVDGQLKYVLRVYILFALLVFASASAQAAELRRLSLDDIALMGTTLNPDPVVKVEGSGSIKISTLWPTTICLGEVQELDVENAQIIYRAKVKSEKLEGTAFLEMWCHVGGGQYYSRGMNSVVGGTMDWRTLQTPFFLQPGQSVKKATLNVVINGKGTIWIDDVHLLKEPLQ